MQSVKLAILVLLFSAFSLASIARVQHTSVINQNCSPTCTLSISSTGSGHLLVLVYATGYSPGTSISSVTGGGTWVASGACVSQDTTGGSGIDIAYVLSSSSGTTSLSITVSHSDTLAAFAFAEYSGGTASLDGSCQTISNQSASTHPLSAAITTAGTNDLIVTGVEQTGFHYGTTTVTNQQGTGWTTPIVELNGVLGFDDDLNVSASTYQASFTGSGSYTYCSSTFAFTFSSGSSSIKHRGQIL